jgi:Ca2+-binding RTX toxin-like protein
MSVKTQSDWGIELRQKPILGGLYAHNYWIMVDSNGKWQGEINGLSSVYDTNSGQWNIVVVGTYGETLRGYSGLRYGNDNHKTIYQYKGSETDVKDRFQSALAANNFLNTKNIRYQSWLWYSSKEQNSNAWATTMGVAMRFNDLDAISHDSLTAPGWGYNLLSKYPENFISKSTLDTLVHLGIIDPGSEMVVPTANGQSLILTKDGRLVTEGLLEGHELTKIIEMVSDYVQHCEDSVQSVINDTPKYLESALPQLVTALIDGHDFEESVEIYATHVVVNMGVDGLSRIFGLERLEELDFPIDPDTGQMVIPDTLDPNFFETEVGGALKGVLVSAAVMQILYGDDLSSEDFHQLALNQSVRFVVTQALQTQSWAALGGVTEKFTDWFGFQDSAVQLSLEAQAGAAAAVSLLVDLIDGGIEDFNAAVLNAGIASATFQLSSIATAGIVSTLGLAGTFAVPIIGTVVGVVIARAFGDLFGGNSSPPPPPIPWAFSSVEYALGEGSYFVSNWRQGADYPSSKSKYYYGKPATDVEFGEKMARAYISLIDTITEATNSKSNNFVLLGDWEFGYYGTQIKNAGINGRTYRSAVHAYLDAYIQDIRNIQQIDGDLGTSYVINNFLNFNDSTYLQLEQFRSVLGIKTVGLDVGTDATNTEVANILVQHERLLTALNVAETYYKYLQNQSYIDNLLVSNALANSQDEYKQAVFWSNYLLQAHLLGIDQSYHNVGDIADNYFRSASGDDMISGGLGSDTIITYSGNDTLLGEGGNDILVGGMDDDILDGGEGNDILLGQDGKDILIGGEGSDTYVIDLQSSYTEIIERENAGFDVIWFDGTVTKDDISTSIKDGQLVISWSILTGTHEVRVSDAGRGIDRLIFSDKDFLQTGRVDITGKSGNELGNFSEIVIDVPLGTTAAKLNSMIFEAASQQNPEISSWTSLSSEDYPRFSVNVSFKLQEGDYYFDEAILIPFNNLALEGAGSGKTIIHIAPELLADAAIQVGYRLYKPNKNYKDWWQSAYVDELVNDNGHKVLIDTRFQYSLLEDPQKGDTSLTIAQDQDPPVDSVGQQRFDVLERQKFKQGDYVYIYQDNTEAFLQELYGDREITWTSWVDKENYPVSKPLKSQMARVIKIEGSTIHLSTPLIFDYEPGIIKIEKRELVEGNVLSGFTLKGGYGASDPNLYENTIDVPWTDENNRKIPGQRTSMIMVGGASHATIADIEIIEPVSHGITLDGSINLNVSDVSVTGAHNKGKGGSGYGIWIRDTFDSYFSNLDIIDTRHAVIFGGWNTASGNSIHLNHTNRDINFHGGLDQNNIVILDEAMRNTIEEQEGLGWATFYNQKGTHYGVPTNPKTNPIYFRVLEGTSKDDTYVFSHLDGSIIKGLGGHDSIVGGVGDDEIDGGMGDDTLMGGAGDDVFVFSEGDDRIYGGDGDDRLIVDLAIDHFGILGDGTTLTLRSVRGVTIVTNVEVFEFKGVVYSRDELPKREMPVPTPSELLFEKDHQGLKLVENLPVGEDWLLTDISSLLGFRLRFLEFTGADYAIAVGNLHANIMIGNKGRNRLEGRNGNDRIEGGDGDDTLLGGVGDDTLLGGAGEDSLSGGEDNDWLSPGSGDDYSFGDIGNDTFEAGSGTDIIDGSEGTDVVRLEGRLAAYAIKESENGFVVSIDGAQTIVSGIENFEFADGSVNAESLVVEHAKAILDEILDSINLDVIIGALQGKVFDVIYAATQYEFKVTKLRSKLQIIVENIHSASLFIHEYATDSTLNLAGINVQFAIGYIGNDTFYTTGTESVFLSGGVGSDTLTGGNGNDWIVGGTGADQLIGGAGNDILYIDARDTVIQGSEGQDIAIVATNQAITLDLGLSGLEMVLGNDSNDTFTNGSTLRVTIDGGQGDDTIKGGAGDDVLIGGEGSDDLQGNLGNDNLVGSDGNDTLYGNQGDDTLTGSNGHDLLNGQEGKDCINGNDGNDTLSGGDDNDILSGGEGHDILNGSSGDDSINGDIGNDILNGGDGKDTLNGGDGDDTLNGGSDYDRMFGGIGQDLINGGLGNDNIEGGEGQDTITGSNGDDTINGGLGDDNLDGGSNNDLIKGGEGNDTLNGAGGIDTLIGGLGDDTYQLDTNTDTITENFNAGTDSIQSSVTYTLGNNLENLTLVGSADINGIGNVVNNIITGNSGVNNLSGAAGFDTLTGGSGGDRFTFKNPNEGIDTITDFLSSQGDKICVSAAGYGGGLAAGVAVTDAQFVLGTIALHARNRFIYNTNTGGLFFDRDGSGQLAAIQIASLSSKPTFAGSDILVLI